MSVVTNVEQELFELSGVDVRQDLSNVATDVLVKAYTQSRFLAFYYAAISVTEKRFMNSIYGATGTIHYEFSNYFCAEDVCLEGQFYIKTGQKILNDYMINHWHKDVELHQKLLDEFAPIDFSNSFDVQLPDIDYVLYIDTDSMYVDFNPLIQAIGFKGKPPQIIQFINEHRLRGLFKDKLGNVVKHRNGENQLKFDLESVSAVGFFLKKKKYLLAYSWLDSTNQIYDKPHENLKGKGIEIARRELSALVIKMIKYILAEIVQKTLNHDNFKSYMKAAYGVFTDERIDVHECCKFVTLNKYDKYVEYSDAIGWNTRKRALPQHKGAALHNHLVMKNKIGDRYPMLRDGYKVGVYTTTSGEYFAFELGNFPHEIAPPIDRHAMFQKVVTTPIVRFATLAGYDVQDVLSDNTQCHI